MNAASAAPIRAFVAACLDHDSLRKVTRAQADLAERCAGLDIRWTSVEQIHLTLRFFGNLAPDAVELAKERLQRAAMGRSAIALKIQGLGCFPSLQRPQVIWLGFAGAVTELEQLQRRVEEETQDLGSHREERTFHPHLTVGRVKAVGREGRQIGTILSSWNIGGLTEWRLETLTLMQSQLTARGSRYTPLTTVALGRD